MGDDYTYEFGEFRCESQQRLLRSLATGEPVVLTPRAFDLLLLFVRRPGEIIEKRRLMEALWPRAVVEENNLDQAVSALRHALGEKRGRHRYIQTIHRRGYRFAASVRVSPAMSDEGAVASSTTRTSWLRAGALPRRVAGTAIALGIVAIVGLVGFAFMPRPEPALVDTSVRSLAILPFKPIAAGDRDDALELGITEALIATLDQPDLLVKPLSSVRQFRDPTLDPLAAGRALGVQAVLEGYLQRDGDRLRVSARLLRLPNGEQLWADRYSESFTDVFSVQDAIAARTWAALMPELRDKATPELPRYTHDTEAYQLYLSGRYHREQRLSADGVRQALGYFEQAVTRDPDFALAWVGVADAYSLLGVFGALAPHDSFPQARTAADRALQLAPELGAAHAALGHVKTQYEHDWQGAQEHLSIALELDPTSAAAHQFRGQFLAYRGRFDEAIEELRKAHALEPAVPNYAAIIGLHMSFQRRHDDSIAQLHRALDMDERQTLARAFLSKAYLHQGDYDRALEEFDRTEDKASFCTGCRGQIYARSGRVEEAKAEVARLIERSREQYVSAYDIASIYASLGYADETFRWLDKAFTERAQHVGWLPWDPAFDGLRADARYVALTERLNIP
jgi:DNA-binding winged helix-turn-helix (wHTH) protein/TolB-like protein/Tfp pilus assembly protein PilF